MFSIFTYVAHTVSLGYLWFHNVFFAHSKIFAPFFRQATLLDHHKSVLPGLIRCDLLVLLWTLLLANIFTLARLQFELRVKRPVCLFCLAQRSSPMVKLLVKLAHMAINRHNRMSRKTCTIFVFDLL